MTANLHNANRGGIMSHTLATLTAPFVRVLYAATAAKQESASLVADGFVYVVTPLAQNARNNGGPKQYSLVALPLSLDTPDTVRRDTHPKRRYRISKEALRTKLSAAMRSSWERRRAATKSLEAASAL